MGSKVFCLVLVVLWLTSLCDGCWDHEKTALLQLKPFFTYHNDVGLHNWVEGSISDCCEWERVQCNNSTRRVIRLFLNITTTTLLDDGEYSWGETEQRYLNVSLFLPFEELNSIYLSGNSLAGFVHHHGFEKLSMKLNKLEILDLSDNYFNESILASLSELSSLKSLNLANNQFTGSNPSDGLKRLTKLKNLKTLDLHGNIFGNSIISNLANFTSLRSLYLQNCGLEGTLQMLEFNNLMNLKELYLSENAIESLGSSFQEEELRLKKLEVLDLSYNLFNSSVFSSLSWLSNLKSLDIEANILEGPIHIQDINALSSLEELYMGDNQVTDFVPSQENERLMDLKELALSGNLFNNSILASLSRLSNLKSLSLGGPKFHGSIDLRVLNALTHLEDLSVYCDYASSPRTDGKCSLPLQSLGLFPSLKTLDFGGLNIQGTIMTSQNEWHNFINLEVLILGHSFLQTNFLGSIGQFTSLKRLDLHDCEISESLTLQGLCEMKYLQELDFSNNNFKGNLPECFSNLTSLERLDLSLNQFSGNISALHSLTSLQTLYLSSNQLSGNIFALESLRFLEILDLSSNQFSGNISALESTSLQTLDLSSNQFSGDISSLKNLASIQLVRLSNNNLEIPVSLGPLFNLSKLKRIYADNNTIYAETRMQFSSAPKFQLKEISLSCCGDVGSFPEFLYHQHDLKDLDLSNIYFKGNQFPDWLLENNTILETLALANSSLSGPLQLPFASQMRLSYLDISNNFFNGSIPVSVGVQLPLLWYLNMSKNHFNGSIASSFGDMTSLGILDLSNNQLSGGIPEHLAMSCPSLGILALSNNKLQGKLFSGNLNLTNLSVLQLDGNNFSGKIPDVFYNSRFLFTLDVSKNQLSGGIPRWMGHMSFLEKIILSNNHLQGTIPVEFCQLDLILLDLSVNNISGSIPSCFNPPRIRQVHLSKNRLRGTLPDALGNSSTLVTLDTSDNLFTSSIPSWIGGLSNLSYLLLSKNNFQGEIPLELCNLNRLSLINLSHNNLSGRIPPCLRITTLEDVPEDYVNGLIAASPTQFSLNEPIDFPIKNVSNSYKGRIISYISGIDLSCNKLVGEIPYQIGKFHKILVLNLSHNSLTGPIPPTFANLGQIESLDLSYNKLSGNIPPQLVRLNFLAYFIVSFNNLSGKTPPRVAQFGTFDESSYRGNLFLCGEPLPKCGDTGPMPNASSDGDEDDGLMDMGVFHVSFIVSYIVMLLSVVVVLYINPYWRRAWFYHVETTATCCYYFVIDNVLPRRFHC